MDDAFLLRQLLVLTRHKIGHPRPSTGYFPGSDAEVSDGLRREIVGLLLMRRDPFFDSTKIIDEFLMKSRAARANKPADLVQR
jgi:hypothetical protein